MFGRLGLGRFGTRFRVRVSVRVNYFRDSFSILLHQKALFRANYLFTKELFATSKRKEPFGAVISRKSP